MQFCTSLNPIPTTPVPQRLPGLEKNTYFPGFRTQNNMPKSQGRFPGFPFRYRGSLQQDTYLNSDNGRQNM
eukprot:919243-Prorocentrum_minimum.AAC.3